MTAWPKYNPEAHEPWMPRASTALMCRRCRDLCGEPIPCRCCETARANEAEAANARYLGTIQQHVFQVERLATGLDSAEAENEALRATVERVRDALSAESQNPHFVNMGDHMTFLDALNRILDALDRGIS